MYRVLAAGALVAAIVFGGMAVAAATPGGGGETPVTLCHATASASNPYVSITVDAASAGGQAQLQGHAGHTGPVFDPDTNVSGDNWGDIIPAYSYVVANGPDAGTTVDYPGMNLDAGAAILANGCALPETPGPTGPTGETGCRDDCVSPSPTPTETPPPTTPPPSTSPPPTTPPPTTTSPPPTTPPPTTPPPVKHHAKRCHGHGRGRPRCQRVVAPPTGSKTGSGPGLAFTGSSAAVPLGTASVLLFLMGLGLIRVSRRVA